MAKKIGMTVEKAYDEAIKNMIFTTGHDGHYTAMLGYIKEDGTIEGPMFIMLERGVAIEMDREGKFVNAYTSKLDRFIPYTPLKCHSGTDEQKRSNELARMVIQNFEEKIAKLEAEVKRLKER
jgi:hypothetical protein